MLPPSWKSEAQKALEEATNRNAAKREVSEAEKSAAITTQLSALVNQLKGQEERERRPREIKVWTDAITLLLVAATAIFTGLAWWIFRGQLHVFEGQLAEMQKVYGPIEESADAAKNSADAARNNAIAAFKQANIMQAQLRPWIKGDFRLNKLSRAQGGQINADISVSYKNVGNYPAPVVFVGGALVPDPELDWQSVELAYCAQAPAAWGNILKNPGNSIFPNEQSPWQSYSSALFPFVIAPWKATRKQRSGRDPTTIPLVYTGCITYGAQTVADVHQTGFMLDFAKGQINGGGAPIQTVFDISSDTALDYDLSGITLMPALYGNFAN